MHIHMPSTVYWLRLFFVKKYTTIMFLGSQSFISLPSVMFVSAAVSEICESNRKKKFENGHSI